MWIFIFSICKFFTLSFICFLTFSFMILQLLRLSFVSFFICGFHFLHFSNTSFVFFRFFIYTGICSVFYLCIFSFNICVISISSFVDFQLLHLWLFQLLHLKYSFYNQEYHGKWLTPFEFKICDKTWWYVLICSFLFWQILHRFFICAFLCPLHILNLFIYDFNFMISFMKIVVEIIPYFRY